jgi:hypothetical protein
MARHGDNSFRIPCSAQGALSTNVRYDRAGHLITDRPLKRPFAEAEQSPPAAATRNFGARFGK